MLEPTADNVLLEIVERVEAFADDLKKRSGLLVDTGKVKQDEPDRGRVVAISPDITDPEYKVGDLVLFKTKEIFQGFKWDDKKLVFMKDHEIIATLIEEGL